MSLKAVLAEVVGLASSAPLVAEDLALNGSTLIIDGALSPGRQHGVNTPVKQVLKRSVPDEHVDMKLVAVRKTVARKEQVAFGVDGDIFLSCHRRGRVLLWNRLALPRLTGSAR